MLLFFYPDRSYYCFSYFPALEDLGLGALLILFVLLFRQASH